MKISPQALHSVVSMCKARLAVALPGRAGLGGCGRSRCAAAAARRTARTRCCQPLRHPAPRLRSLQLHPLRCRHRLYRIARNPACICAHLRGIDGPVRESTFSALRIDRIDHASTKVPQRVPLQVQGVAAAGVTVVRVKAAEIGADATVLDVSISFANRITDTATMLALADTYLQDESGARLHIKAPTTTAISPSVKARRWMSAGLLEQRWRLLPASSLPCSTKA